MLIIIESIIHTHLFIFKDGANASKCKHHWYYCNGNLYVYICTHMIYMALFSSQRRLAKHTRINHAVDLRTLNATQTLGNKKGHSLCVHTSVVLCTYCTPSRVQ